MTEPYFTNEERKASFSFRGDYFYFETCCDLSQGVKVTASRGIQGDALKWTPKLVQDTACFTAHWLRVCHSRLNGFSGLDSIKYTVEI